MIENPLHYELARESRREGLIVAISALAIIATLTGMGLATIHGNAAAAGITSVISVVAYGSMYLAQRRYDVVENLHARFEPQASL